MYRKGCPVAGDPDTPRPGTGGSAVSEPLHRALFRESALAHYERWGGDPAGGWRRPDGGPAKRWRRVVVATALVCLVMLGAVSMLVRVQVFATVTVLITHPDGARPDQPDQVIAVFPASAAGRVRQGTTVQVLAAHGTGTQRIAVSGDGRVLTTAQISVQFPALASAGGLPARGVLAWGDSLPAPVGDASGVGRGTVVVTAKGQVGDQPLIRLLGTGSRPKTG